MAAELLGSILDLSTRTQVPVLIWGAPGIGKSAAVRHWAKARGMECWVVIASLREPSDFSGLPVVGPSAQGNARASVDFVPPRFATEAAEKGGVIFLDELTTAPPAVQAALLRAVLDKAFGDLQLDPTKVTIIAAANPPSLAAGGWDLSPPLANRFLHVDYEVSTPEWAGLDGFPSYWGSPPNIAFRREKVSEADWSVARNLVAGFIRKNPGALLSVPRDTAAQGRPWPSPRTWDFVSRMVAVWKTPSEVAENLGTIAGCIGEGPAREFATYVREADLQDPEQILADPSAYRHPARGDLAYIAMNSVMLATKANLTEPRWRAAWEFLGALKDQHMVADVAVIGARFLAPFRTGVADGSSVLPPVPQMVLFPDILGEGRSVNTDGYAGAPLRNASVQMAAARIRLSETRPYISHALFAITMRPLPGLGTIGVDRHWRLVYDPATVVTWTVPEVAGVLYHEVWHLLRDHAGRAAGRDAQVWNLACDAEINDDLRDEMKDDRRPGGPAFLLPGQPVLPASFGMPDGLTAEEYYDQLVKEQAPQPGGAIPQSGGASPRSGGAIPQPDGAAPQSGGATPQPGGATGSASGEALNSTQRDVASGRCGSAATGVAEPWEATFDGDDQSPGAGKVDAQDTRISPGEARVIRGVVAEAIVRNRGTVPGHALLHAERELAPGRVDWRAELRSVIARTIATVAGAIDYSYARPSRRQSALGNVIMPSLREPVVRVAIIADTSGSMGSDYGKVLREIETIIKGFGRNDAVPVFSVDAAVHTRQRVRNVAEVQLIGGGGTDMRLGIGEAYTLRPRPDVAVVLTDGCTPWPEIPPPGMRVVAGIIGGTSQGVPGWMRTVLIDASG